MTMATGTVKWFNATTGFGFIQPTDGGTDVFVQINAVERAGTRDLTEGQKISMMLSQTGALASRRRTISSRRDGAFPHPVDFRLIGTTSAAGR
jgi:CspA family cold shock protein